VYAANTDEMYTVSSSSDTCVVVHFIIAKSVLDLRKMFIGHKIYASLFCTKLVDKFSFEYIFRQLCSWYMQK